jgi:hypothetical protein
MTPEETERVELLETQVRVLFAMIHPIGRGLSSVMDVLGLDHGAACAELDEAARQAPP